MFWKHIRDCRVDFVTENLFSNFLCGPLEKCGKGKKMKKCHVLSERQKLLVKEALISLKISQKWLTVAISQKWQDSIVALWIEIAVILNWR